MTTIPAPYAEPGATSGPLPSASARAERDRAFLSAIVDSSPDAIIGRDLDGIIVTWNKGAERLLGYTAAEAIGQPLLMIVPDDIKQIVAEAMPHIHEGQDFISIDTTRLAKDGRVVNVAITAARVLDAQGHVIGVGSVVRDITERLQMQEALRASESRLRQLVDNAQDIIWESELDGRLTFVNSACEQHLGYTPAELEGRPISVLLPPEDDVRAREILAGHLDHIAAGEQPPPMEFDCQHIRKDEQRIYVQAIAFVLLDAAGLPYRLQGITRNVDAHKRAEVMLRESEERLRLVFANSPSPVAIYDEHGEIKEISPAIAGIMGVPPDVMLERMAEIHAAATQLEPAQRTVEGLAAAGITTEDFARNWLGIMQAIAECARQPGARVHQEQRVKTATGEIRDLSCMYQAFSRGASGIEIVSTIHDVTAMRALARLLQEANSELEQRVQERTAELRATVEELRHANAGKDSFLAAISHELRTPLMGVLSMSEVLESEIAGPLTPNQARYVGAIRYSGDRLLDTVNSVLLYTELLANTTPVRSEICRLAELCTIASRSVRDSAERKQQSLRQEIVPFDLEIRSDADGIMNVLKLLLHNAVKFTPEHGAITLTAAGTSEADSVRITVADTGIGMTTEQMAGIFRPFYQADKTLTRRYEGLGLGLAYVHAMIQRLGGSVAVESSLGQGSCFTITLPRHMPLT